MTKGVMYMREGHHHLRERSSETVLREVADMNPAERLEGELTTAQAESVEPTEPTAVTDLSAPRRYSEDKGKQSPCGAVPRRTVSCEIETRTQDWAVTICVDASMHRLDAKRVERRPSLRPYQSANPRKPPSLSVLGNVASIFMAWNGISALIME